MKLITGYENKKARIEMLPLIDVMFLILVFFIYSIFSMSVHRGLKVNLPEAKGSPEVGDMSTITLTADNRLYFNREEMSMEEITASAVASWESQGLPVLIKADKSAELGVGIKLLGVLKAGGVERVAFMVEE